MEINKKTLRSVFWGAAGCIFLYWLLHETERVAMFFRAIFGILSPFIAGAAIAFVLNVPMRAIEKTLKGIKKPGLRRGLAILLTFLAVLLCLTGVIYLLIPQITATVESLISKLPDFVERVRETGLAFLNDHPELMDWLSEYTSFDSIDWTGLIQKVIGFITDGFTSIADAALTTVVTLSAGIFNAVLSIVFGLYCLGRKEILARQGRRLLYSIFPEKMCDETVRILRMTNSAFSNFISGQCLEALILGCMFAVAMSIFRMPYMPLVSVIIAITALVPIVGAFVGCALGAFFILVDNPVLAFWFVIMFLLLQQIEGNMIYPRVVGSSIGLPGMWVLLAVAVGGDLMGVSGMLIMIPLASVLYTLLREFTQKRLSARGIDPDKLRDHPPTLRSGFKQKQIDKRERKRKQKKEERLQQETQQENVNE